MEMMPRKTRKPRPQTYQRNIRKQQGEALVTLGQLFCIPTAANLADQYAHCQMRSHIVFNPRDKE